MKMKHMILFLLLIIGLPFLGVIISGASIELYTLYSPYAINIASMDALPDQPFSWAFSMGLFVFGGTLTGVFLLQLFRNIKKQTHKKPNAKRFPWWGWVALICLFIFWSIAWLRPSGIGILKHFTFTILWCSYITLVNALTYTRTGKCLLINRRSYLLKLFLFSIPFWWYFEYLNRYVLNWYYLVGDAFHSSEYLVFGTLAFATVLPAVLSTRDLILSFSSIHPGFDNLGKLQNSRPKLTSAIVFVTASLSLASLGIWPQYLYPLLWISPLLVLVSLQAWWGQKHIFCPLAQGNYSVIVASALAALMCGSIWEIWNFYSAPKWVYSVPWVYGFKIFEMPIIGYLGYLPFGLECLAIGEIIEESNIQ